MFIVLNGGGLGNQMFQYAFAKNLQQATQQQVMMCSTLLLKKDTLGRINLLKALAPQLPYAKGLKQFSGNLLFRVHRAYPQAHKLPVFNRLTVRYEQDLAPNYDSEFFRNLAKSKSAEWEFIFGFWQEAAMLHKFKKELVKELQTDCGWTDEIRALKKELEQEAEPVAIHFRHRAYSPLGLEYYVAALDIIRAKTKKPSFYVFSDDNKQTAELLKHLMPAGKYKLFPHYRDALKAYQTLLLMADCRHFVMSRSTFCWWAAWLSWARSAAQSNNCYLMPAEDYSEALLFSPRCLRVPTAKPG